MIFICDDGRIKILDIGVQQVLEKAQNKGPSSTSMPYVAPELLTDGKPVPASDLYSFGLILWEMLVGKKACERNDLYGMMWWHTTVGAPDVRSVMENQQAPLALPNPTTSSVKRKRKPAFNRIVATGASADIIVAFYQSRATMCGKDFLDLPVEDPSKILYALATRGDLVRISSGAPFYYQITPQGINRAERILEIRRETHVS